MNDKLMPADAAFPRPFLLSGDEWMAIMLDLEQFHAVFYKLWEIGMPIFTDQVETAAVHFDKGGEFVQFRFNPAYWTWCTPYERLFTICHESLHILLNHGVRSRDATDKAACNVALDIVTNHLLVRAFGFDRSRIRNSEELCWVDTVFSQDDGRSIPDDESFECYLGLIEGSTNPPTSPGEVQGADEVRTVDDDAGLGETDTGEIMRRVGEALTDEEKQFFESLFDGMFKKPGATQAGSDTSGLWHVAKVRPVKPKRRWETVIKQWVRKKMQEAAQDEEQWAIRNQRYLMLHDALFLPSEVEADGLGERKDRIKVRFYLDTSASCWHLKDRFFAAALSIPKDRFDVTLFCFDTQVVPTDMESRRLCGGGGTSFRILEEDIKRAMARERAEGSKGEYPDAVFVLTDGRGDRVVPAMPQRWYFFIDAASPWRLRSMVGKYVPAGCNVFDLADFI